MRHLIPSPSPYSIKPSSTSLYTFLSFSPIKCIPHVALNPDAEWPCILCRHSQTIFPKIQKASLKNRNVDLDSINVGPYVALNPGMELPCILCRLYRVILSKSKKLPLGNQNVGLATMNVDSNVALNPGVERSCILLQENRVIFPKTQNLIPIEEIYQGIDFDEPLREV
jgi:hypothetical protein